MVDRSGSMGVHLTPMSILVQDLVGRLTRDDRVALVAFSDAAELVEPLSVAPGRAVEELKKLRSSDRSDFSAWRDVAIGALAGAGGREATRSIALFSDLLPNVGEVPEALREPVEEVGGWTFAGRSFVVSWKLPGSLMAEMPGFKGCHSLDHLLAACREDVEELWITSEGTVRPWWCYELIPEAHR